MAGILVGVALTNKKPTPDQPKVTNLKRDLLKLIKIVELGYHTYECAVPGTKPFFRQPRDIDTLRLILHMTGDQSTYNQHPEFCRIGYEGVQRGYAEADGETVAYCWTMFYTCGFFNKLRPKKVVLTSIREADAWKVMERLGGPMKHIKELTIVVSPDDHCCTVSTASEIKGYINAEFSDAKEIALRIIFAPWSKKIARTGAEKGSAEFWRGRQPVTEGGLVDFIAKVASAKYKTVVYMIEGAYADCHERLITNEMKGKDLPPIQDTEARVEEKWAEMEKDEKKDEEDDEEKDEMGDEKVNEKKWPSLVMKTRAHYLREGVRDEIDEEELCRWWDLEEASKVADEATAGTTAEAKTAEDE